MLELKIPPLSINQAWQGRRFKTNQYKDWIERGLYLLRGVEKQTKPYKMEIEFYIAPQMDIDNPIKMFLDLLQKAGVIENDRWIVELHIKKIVSKEKKIRIKFL